MLPAVENSMAFDYGERVRGIEPPCAAWEAAVLPLNYTREEIFDFRFAIDDCNRNKFQVEMGLQPKPSRARRFQRTFSFARRRTVPEDREAYSTRSSTITATKLHRQPRCSRFYRLSHRPGLNQETSR